MNIEEKRNKWESLGWFKEHEEKLGSIIWLEMWRSPGRQTTGHYVLYRDDTGEIVGIDLLPEDETMPEKVQERLQTLRRKLQMA